MKEKQKIFFDAIFDIFKIIFGYEVVFAGATILQTSSGAIPIKTGSILLVGDIVFIILTLLTFGTVLYDAYLKIED
ncbi:hypothetical protein [Methanocaldococcus jannaschii]|uniref:hypothetical protein n=1 Tax=Methanocaldococcus jannaschii TaxID=2190 RepID=UPI0007DC105D|nr:hypothetical protein [Methanocaldococcus jannaschii]